MMRYFVWVTLSLTTTLYAGTAMLRLDVGQHAERPKHFRITQTRPDLKLNWRGFQELNAAASGQFSSKSLLQVLDIVQSKKIYIVDLRQESHGFIDGNAVSLYRDQNTINQGYSDAEIVDREKNFLEAIAAKPFVFLQDEKEGLGKKTSSKKYTVKDVFSEDALARKHQIHYQRFYVQDHHAPNIKTTKAFVRFVKDLPKDTMLYFHCRGGRGRSTTFLMMYDILKNGKTVSLDAIFNRHVAIGSKDLRVLPEKNSPKYPFAVERLEFIRHFYDTYAKF